ncbi:MAG: YbgC/FadM family acyl-CoA thioesterase [Sphingomonadaceae bacterium]
MSASPQHPTAGYFIGAAHHLPIRVYFEDTDFSGLVYHANYLRYMERARSDMLRVAGADQKAAYDSGEGVYAVAELSIKYLRPAHYDDALLVISRIDQLRAASVAIHQRVMLGDQTLTDARVTAAFLSREGRPKRQPKVWIEAFETIMKETHA